MELPSSNLSIPAAWLGREMKHNPDAWLLRLEDADVTDLEGAARHFQSLGRDVGEITKETFPLSRFQKPLASLRRELIDGIGFGVLRGLPVRNYSPEFVGTIFCGIGAHLGSARSQNAAGHILGHVRDTGASSSNENVRIYQTSERQTFHTDSADVVGLLCLREAMEGGMSLLVSAVSIYNRIRAERPDLLPLLFEPLATDRRGEIPAGEKPFMEIPPVSWHRDHLTVFYQRQYIDSAQRFKGTKALTEAHVEALDLFDALANDPDFHLSMQLQSGDMQFVYNHALMHDRTAFTDWPDPQRRRHLLRIWLSIPGDRPLPECFKQRYGSIEIGNRGGIVTEKTRLQAPLY